MYVYVLLHLMYLLMLLLILILKKTVVDAVIAVAD